MSARPIDLRTSAHVDVLVIEASEPLRDAMVEALSESGLTVRGLDSPTGATRAIVRNEARLVIISMELPEIRGEHLVSLLRGIERLSELPVVMATSGIDPTVRRRATGAGADAIYQTQDDLATLVDMVRTLLGLRPVSGTRRRPELPPKR